MNEKERLDAAKAVLRADGSSLPTSAIGRFWRTGRAALGMVSSLKRGEADLGDADLERVLQSVSRLGELKGVAMKVGQMLGYVDTAVPERVRATLSLLQTQSSATPFSAVESALREAFGSRAQVLIDGLEREPVAVASIGQVHRARLPDGTWVAVKVRHPGIERAMAADFRAAGMGASFAKMVVPGASGASVQSFVNEARDAFLEECDFSLEAARQREFGRLFSGHPVLRVPAVRDEFCAPGVLCTEWMSGQSLDTYLASGASQQERDRVGIALFEFYVGSLYAHGTFHADPHPGNYGFRDDGTIVVYDFGCVRRYDRETVIAFAGLVSAVRLDDRESITAAMRALGGEMPADAKAFEHLRTLLRGFFAPLLLSGPRPMKQNDGTGRFEMAKMMADKKAVMRLSLPGKLLFLFRLRFGVYSVLERLGSVADWAGMESRWAQIHGVGL